MHTYFSIKGASLPSLVGKNKGDIRVSDLCEGYLAFGPYIEAGPGLYTAAYAIKSEPENNLGNIIIDVVCESGATILARENIKTTGFFSDFYRMIYIDFDVDRYISDVEVRIQIDVKASISIRELVIFKRRF